MKGNLFVLFSFVCLNSFESKFISVWLEIKYPDIILVFQSSVLGKCLPYNILFGDNLGRFVGQNYRTCKVHCLSYPMLPLLYVYKDHLG